MKKEKRTARELAKLIAERLGTDEVFVSVNRDPAYGWHPTVVTTPGKAIGVQQMAEQIAMELRAKFELAE